MPYLPYFQAAPGHDVPRVRQLQGRQDEERQRIRKSLTPKPSRSFYYRNGQIVLQQLISEPVLQVLHLHYVHPFRMEVR